MSGEAKPIDLATVRRVDLTSERERILNRFMEIESLLSTDEEGFEPAHEEMALVALPLGLGDHELMLRVRFTDAEYTIQAACRAREDYLEMGPYEGEPTISDPTPVVPVIRIYKSGPKPGKAELIAELDHAVEPLPLEFAFFDGLTALHAHRGEPI